MASRYIILSRRILAMRGIHVAVSRQPFLAVHVCRTLTTRSEQAEATNTFAPGSVIANTEQSLGPKERHTFQAETKQLLNIVANSLYTDKHVFIRELVSNASDALEKLRHAQVAGEASGDTETPLQIRITTDEATNTITIADTGIGMSKNELIENLGTIARSGSKAFLEKLKLQGKGTGDIGTSIIGQFGVGFYSAFMVCDRVEVFSQSAAPGSPAYCWTSEGDGSYEISDATGCVRGTKIVIRLRDSCREFSNPITVKDVLMRYSQFVNFPITLNGKQVNTVQAIWSMAKSGITDDMYNAFFKFKSGDYEAPLYRLHFSSDAPIALNALLFVGQTHEEKYGLGRIKPGVDLYSRKVLIEPSSKVLPDWLRFLHGVVDSEDIPLNISRETMQDSALIKRLASVLTRRVLRFFDSEARRDPERYNSKFFSEFGQFLKEGAITDTTYAADIAKLLRFESSALPAGTLTSFDEYISRMPPGQKDIYYLVAPHRGVAETSPYMEAFKGARKHVGATAAPAEPDVVVTSDAAEAAAVPSTAPDLHVDDVEVLFLYSSLDDFVMNNTREFSGRKLVTAETAELNPDTLKGLSAGADKDGKDATSATASAPGRLTEAQVEELGAWLVATLPSRLSKVRSTNRLTSSPAVVTDHESAAMRRMMRMVEQTAGKDAAALKSESHMLPKQTLEINPSHPIIVRLFSARADQPTVAVAVAEQIVDNALIAAGLVDDSRTMLPRLTALLELVLGVDHGYAGEAVLEGKRFIPERERDERAGIDLSAKLVEDMRKEMDRQESEIDEKKP